MKNHQKVFKTRRSAQAGFTLVEILISLVVLTIGLLGVAILFATAVANNQRNKVDSGATLVSETVLDQISANNANSAGTIGIVDCTGVTRNFSLVSGAQPNGQGATLLPTTDPATPSGINWTAGANGNTNNFVMCGPAGTQLTYEVRWNVMNMPVGMDATSSPYLRLVAVSSRQLNQGTNLRFFNPPVTLRTVVGMN
jgi:prepilin-type N-terminal cleavage/methylation domain-containing protein